MPGTDSSSAAGERTRDPAPRAFIGAALLVVLALYAVPLVLGTPLLDPDEGLHAAIAQAMVERGDWVTPTFLGQPFLDKPILFFWTQALSLQLGGMTEAAVRLPGFLFALFGSVTTGVLAWRLLANGRLGVVAALCHATLLLPMAIAQAPVHDVAVVPFGNLALLSLWEGRRAPGRAPIRWAASAGLCLGLSILAKGLVAVALVGVAFGGFLVMTRTLRQRDLVAGTLALALAASVAAPWYLEMEARHAGYLYYYFVGRHWLGAVTATQLHGNAPWWYYAPVVLFGGLPWIAYAPVVAARDWFARARRPRPAGFEARQFLWFWTISGLVLLSVARSKLGTYVLPVFPAIAILSAAAWMPPFRDSESAAARRLAVIATWVVTSIGSALLPLLLAASERTYDVRYPAVAWAAAWAFGPVCWFWVRPWQPPSAGRTVIRIVCLQSAAMLAVMTLAFPPVATLLSARDLAEHFNRIGRFPPQLLVVNERVGSLVFYLEPALRRTIGADQVRSIDLRSLGDSPTPPGTLVAIPQRLQAEADRLWSLSPATGTEAGHFRVYDASAMHARDK